MKRLSLTRTLQKKLFPVTLLFVLAIGTAAVLTRTVSPKPKASAKQESVNGHKVAAPPVVDASMGSSSQVVARAKTPGSASVQVYVDPVTGKIGVPPPAAELAPRVLSPAEQQALSTSSEDLVEKPVVGPAGGIILDVQGRFRSTVVATVDAVGRSSIQCQPDAVASTNSSQAVATKSDNARNRPAK